MNSLKISSLFSNGTIYHKCLKVQEGYMLDLHSWMILSLCVCIFSNLKEKRYLGFGHCAVSEHVVTRIIWAVESSGLQKVSPSAKETVYPHLENDNNDDLY